MQMATIHISAAEAARDFTALLAHVRPVLRSLSRMGRSP